MKLVFLDIDGVLNHHEWLKGRKGHKDPGIPAAFRDECEQWSARSIDPSCVQRLNRLTEATGCRYVLSSTWRTMYHLPKLNSLLRYHGFNNILVGTTPSMSGMPIRGIVPGARRGTEIDAWLHEMALVDVTFIILDDDDDMAPYEHRLIQTDFGTGLTDEHVETAIEMLGPKEDASS